jgi:hypothetical protein
MWFYVPDYLTDDFDDSLDIDGKTCTINYNAVTPTTAKINFVSLDFKSNQKGLSDSTFGIEFSKSLTIRKGDYITDDINNYFLVNWFPAEFINCYTAQVQLCTVTIDFERYSHLKYDYAGKTTTPSSYDAIASSVKGYFYRYGMGPFDTSSGKAGIPPSQKICLGIQYNSLTSLIKISDEFTLNGMHYVITDTDFSQLNDNGSDGILIIYAQVQEGGRKT